MPKRRSISVVDHRTPRNSPQPPEQPDWPTNVPASAVATCDLSYRAHGRRVVRRLTFAVRSGECVHIIEPRADRRTALTLMLTGLAAPTEGWIGHGFDVRDVALVPSHVILAPTASLQANAAVWARLFRLERCEHAVRLRDAFEITGLSSRRHQMGHTADSDLLRRTGIAVALLRRPRALVLDLPAGVELTDDSVDSVLQRLRTYGIAIVVVSGDEPNVSRLVDRTVQVA
jgi:ABC-2 type transport system ATP-binding protein